MPSFELIREAIDRMMNNKESLNDVSIVTGEPQTTIRRVRRFLSNYIHSGQQLHKNFYWWRGGFSNNISKLQVKYVMFLLQIKLNM